MKPLLDPVPKKNFGLFFILLFINCNLSSQAYAFTPSVTANGVPIQWSPPVTLSLAGNPTGDTDLSNEDFFAAVTQSLQRWKSASLKLVDFEYWQGTDPANFPTTGVHDGLSTVFFVSQSSTPSRLTASILASTQVWYNSYTGEVLEADITLNDRDFYFTNHPQDSTEPAIGNPQLTQSRPHVFIQNTLAHEMGHALGLSHSGVLQSTMLYMEAPDQAYLSCDDQVGIQSLYPSPQTDLTGALHGLIQINNTPLFGAHVVAISQARGTILASALTDHSGIYHFPHLEPGSYLIMAEPYYAGPESLPSYFFKISPPPCPGGEDFKRTFLTAPQNDPFEPQRVSVLAGMDTTAKTISVSCQSTPHPMENTGPILNLPANDFARIDLAPPQSTIQYLLKNGSGVLTVHAMSFSLYSPAIGTLSLVNEGGAPIEGTFILPDYKSSDYSKSNENSEFKIYDGLLTTPPLPLGNYRLTLSSQSLSSNFYPAGIKSLDSSPFFLIFGSTEGSPLRTTFPASNSNLTLANNPRCRQAENFHLYKSPPTYPRRRFAAHFSPSCSGGQSGTGGCAKLQTKHLHQNSSLHPENRPSPIEPVVGWFLPWIFAWGGVRLLIFLHRPTAAIRLKP